MNNATDFTTEIVNCITETINIATPRPRHIAVDVVDSDARRIIGERNGSVDLVEVSGERVRWVDHGGKVASAHIKTSLLEVPHHPINLVDRRRSVDGPLPQWGERHLEVMCKTVREKVRAVSGRWALSVTVFGPAIYAAVPFGDGWWLSVSTCEIGVVGI